MIAVTGKVADRDMRIRNGGFDQALDFASVHRHCRSPNCCGTANMVCLLGGDNAS
jgi:hypothetical protein